MASKRTTVNAANEPLRAALDVGNGECAGVSNERPYDAITFEPVVAPISEKRGLSASEERPTYSLKQDGHVFVFGVDDVFTHGQRDNLRRLNSLSRYGDADYLSLIDVLLLNVFASLRGKPERHAPSLALNLPVEQYNKETLVESLKADLAGKRDIADFDGCVLQLDIDPARITVLPESAGAMMHWAFDPQTLEKRAGVSTGGVSLVVDVGYLTTDTTLFEGMKYQRDRAFTLDRAGMGNVVGAVRDHLLRDHRLSSADPSRVDLALRPLATKSRNEAKWLELSHNAYDVTDVYDTAVSNLAARVAQFIQSQYQEDTQRVILTGGGAYHLMSALKDLLPPTFGTILRPPDPALANVYGAYTTLKVKESRAK